MKRALVGVLAFAAMLATLWPLVRRAAVRRGLTARLVTHSLVSADGSPGVEFAGAPPSARAVVDGAPASGPLGPGLHTIGYDITRRRRTAEQVHAAVLAGPFARDGWARCAARVELSQKLLDLRVEPLVADLVKQTLGDVADLPPVRSTKVDLAWTKRGLAVDLVVHFTDKTQLRVGSELALHLAGDRVLVTRAAAVRASIKGPLVDQALDEYVPDAVKKHAPWAMKLLHKVTDRAVRWYAQRVARDKSAQAIDLELIPQALAILRLPPPLDVPGVAGARLELRFCTSGGLALEKAHHARVSFDLRVLTPPGASSPGPLLARGRVAAPPATPPGPDAELTLEISVDALNAALDGAWRARLLDRELADPALQARLDADLDPLDFRARELAAPLPPVITSVAPRPGGATLALAGELSARLVPRGRGSVRDARLFVRGGVAITLAKNITVAALPSEARLTCRAPHPEGGVLLSACYSDLMTLITVAMKTPGNDMLDTLVLPLDAVVPQPPPASRITWTVERLALSAPDPGWLRLDARATFRAR